MDFSNRHIVVTGGTGALGAAVIGALLEGGAVCYVPALGAEDLTGFAHRGHQRVRVMERVDLTGEDGASRVYGGFMEGKERLWASLHLAGGFDMGAIEGTSREAWQKMIEMNATTCFLCCREAVRAMKGAGGGRIVNVAARPALRPEQGAKMVSYVASKAAVAAITQALAAEVQGDGILVNAVAPSIMDTPANRAAMPKADFSRWPKVEEVAGAILCLAAPENTLTSGAVVPVYGRS